MIIIIIIIIVIIEVMIAVIITIMKIIIDVQWSENLQINKCRFSLFRVWSDVYSNVFLLDIPGIQVIVAYKLINLHDET